MAYVDKTEIDITGSTNFRCVISHVPRPLVATLHGLKFKAESISNDDEPLRIYKIGITCHAVKED